MAPINVELYDDEAVVDAKRAASTSTPAATHTSILRIGNVDGRARATDLEEQLTRWTDGVRPVRVRVERDPFTGKSKGVAYATFAGEELPRKLMLGARGDAATAMDENAPSFLLMGRLLKLSEVAVAPESTDVRGEVTMRTAARSARGRLHAHAASTRRLNDELLPAAVGSAEDARLSVVKIDVGTYVRGPSVKAAGKLKLKKVDADANGSGSSSSSSDNDLPFAMYVAATLERQRSINLAFNPHTRLLAWVLRQHDSAQDCVFEAHFSALRESVLVERVLDSDGQRRKDEGPQRFAVTMHLRHPPRLSRGVVDWVEEHGPWDWSRELKVMRQRTTSIDGHENVDFGANLVYRFHFTFPSTFEAQSFLRKLRPLMLLNLDGSFISRNDLTTAKVEVMRELPWRRVDPFDESAVPGLAFSLRYLVQALVSKGVLNKYLVSDVFLERVRAVDVAAAESALEIMLQKSSTLFDAVGAFEAALRSAPRLNSVALKLSKSALPDHCLIVRKVIVTPTRLVFLPIELGNRVLRRFDDTHDRFLRVSFAEENQSKHLEGQKIAEEITERIRTVLRDGLRLGDRHYRFLAFSSSQLRDHACWFYGESENSEWTCAKIRAWMGEFDHIKTVAKYAARLGQRFSSTTPVGVQDLVVENIPDVERNGFCFSDGIGCISTSFAKRVSETLQLDKVPSAFQIRLGGYKGVLSVDPSIPADSGDVVRLRPSMKKFDAEIESLGVVRHSTFAPAYLNHQIITLLASVHIEDEVFVALQERMKRALDAMFESKEAALRVMNQCASEAETFRILSKLINAGVPMRKEPFIFNVVSLFQCCKMKEVRQKARVLVEDGAQLVGVLDETARLEYGQLFVQITDPLDPTGATKRVITGTVLMAKMPAVHPGDVRVLECVDDPALHHYCDVAVFPQNGARPHTYVWEASGSDLDGDVYLITWNPDLIPTVRNFRPLEYEAPKPVTVEDRVTIDNIISFFLDYIRNDNLGLIAVAHKIHADLNANGVLSDKCIELAKLHTLAVDFPKTGVPAHFDPQRYRTPQRPDFLCSRGGRAENSYVSQKALGKMFRAACNRAFTPDYSKVVVDARFLAAGLDAYFDEALAVKSCFDFDVRRILLQFGVRSEFELFTQFIFDFDRHGTTREFEMKERLRNLVRQMTTQYELIFWEGRGKLERRVTKEACAKAAAWYFVTYESARERVASGRIFKWDERPLIALPWLIVSELLLTNFRRNGGETADTKVPTADMARYRHVLVDARRAIVSQQAQAAVRRTDPEGDELQEEQQEDGEQEDENNGYPRRAFTSFATFKKSREVAEMAQEDASEVDSGNMTMTDSANTSRTDSTVSASMEEQPETAILSREQTERPIVAPIIADFEVLDLDG